MSEYSISVLAIAAYLLSLNLCHQFCKRDLVPLRVHRIYCTVTW